jgi:xanthine phosphoribosyltransferase
MSKYLNISWEQFHRDTQSLAQQLRNTNRKWSGIIGVARGGLVPAAIIAHELGIRLVDTICINSYDDETLKSKNLEVLKRVTSEDDTLIVVDDLVDTGSTFDVILSMVPNAYRCAVYAKPLGISSTDSFIKEVPQETWLVFPWEESK